MRITAPVTDYIRESVLTTQGDLAVRGAALVERLAAGIAGTYFQGKGAATKPAYEKTMPPLTTLGDLIVQGAALPERKFPGAAGTVLTSAGVATIPIYINLFNLLTTQGDLWVRGVVAPQRLAAAGAGYILQSQGVGAIPIWRSWFDICLTDGDMWVRSAGNPIALAAGALDTYFKGQGAGVLPIYEKMHLKDTGVKIGNSTRNIAGDQVIAGVGFQPSIVIFLAVDDLNANGNASWGFDDGSTPIVLEMVGNGANIYLRLNFSIYIKRVGANSLTASISALSADGFTITWSLTGACVVNYAYLALP